MHAELVAEEKALLGEGSIWNWEENLLYWLDILGKKLFIYDPKTGRNKSHDLPQKPGTVVPGLKNKIILALQDGIYNFEPATGKSSCLLKLESENDGNRFNDGKCDPAGRFWLGSVSMNCDIPGAGSLYRIDSDLSAHRMLGNLTISNGLCWAKNKPEMYFIDSPTHEIWTFSFDSERGEITDRKTLLSIPEEEGIPDGMTIDSNDNIWVAQFAGSRVCCYSTDKGSKLEEVMVPANQVTSCAFGGEKLDRLFITTALNGLDEEERRRYPHAGRLFAVSPGVRGVRCPFFGG